MQSSAPPNINLNPQEKLTVNDKKQIIQNYYTKMNPYEFSSELSEIAPQIDTLKKLIEYENKIDKILVKKKSDIQEQLLRPFPKIKRILRIHIFNTFEYQNNALENVKLFIFLFIFLKIGKSTKLDLENRGKIIKQRE